MIPSVFKLPVNSAVLSQLHCAVLMGGWTRGEGSLMVAFRKVFGMPLEAMIVQILGKSKNKKDNKKLGMLC
jgi:hypothetical protein